MRRALVSVTDKTGMVEFARLLSAAGFELVSTGGTAGTLREAGLAVTEVADITGFPEILGGRVKTLHPAVHGGLLADLRRDEHRAQLAEHGLAPFEVVAVNLYAFEKTVLGEPTLDQAVESIDIGGPAMVRASAKNFANVTVVVDPSDYARVGEALTKGPTDLALRQELAAKAFRHTAFYDSLVSRYLTGLEDEPFPTELTIGLRRVQTLRYGENPHQRAAAYLDPLAASGIARAKSLWGKELSYNNLLDADAAWELVSDLPAGSCAIIKHGNPCGAACAKSLGEAYCLARQADPVSAFGGIAAFHGEVDRETAEAFVEKGNFLEIVLATGFTPEALDLVKGRSGWGQDVRLLEVPVSPAQSGTTLRSIRGGYLVQEGDEEPLSEWRVATSLAPTEMQWAALRFAWKVVQHVKSNAIVIALPDRLLGVGAGQMNRVQSVRLALAQAGEEARGAALASDAFFPFSDSVETAAEAGIGCIVQPGGSKRDAEVAAKAEELGVPLVFTGVRHFRH
ncbi:MAG: bifunctional phosphoribosylaminoimidazolecarboxamide formyltransferase/IMP cyclohydrolase [Fimbriimonadaceae bacterium]|nr:bifunctional phosphoribosylaminoimidazolecarboxamide formyltransferase/IMP cyclohydrolase [Fimbriimonadaceae bacterium]QYK56748.1 MAG: bifunctional phosphoribosylaminoimidazolecarboxamide formyltransferase/IMP cyclohydrolase [Fimbriimonadaceae bacterium]